jgi:histidine ammonia-lyase
VAEAAAAAAAAALSAAAHMPELSACLKSGWLGGMCVMAHSATKMAVQPTAFTWQQQEGQQEHCQHLTAMWTESKVAQSADMPASTASA